MASTLHCYFYMYIFDVYGMHTLTKQIVIYILHVFLKYMTTLVYIGVRVCSKVRKREFTAEKEKKNKTRYELVNSCLKYILNK